MHKEQSESGSTPSDLSSASIGSTLKEHKQKVNIVGAMINCMSLGFGLIIAIFVSHGMCACNRCLFHSVTSLDTCIGGCFV